MNAEEIVDEICEALYGNIDEPAGHGCGYGVTEDGTAEILAIIKRIIPQTRKEDVMSETTTTPVYVSGKTKRDYKVTAKATTLVAHGETQMLIETVETAILDGELYKGHYSGGMAEYAARKDIEKMIEDGLKVKMEDVEVTARPF